MKKLILALTLVLLALPSVTARERVMETSERRKPAWAKNLLEQNFVIAVGTGATQADAQQHALLLVKQDIVRSIAEQVISVSTREVREANGQFTDAFTQSVTAKASRVPYVQGISTNQVQEFYWERLRNTKSKQESFRYYIKYPFSNAQLNRLVAEFRREDMKITERINELESALGTIETVEQIDAAIDELDGLVTTLEDNRKERSRQLQLRYRALYESIVMVETGSTLGTVAYRLELGGRAIQSSLRPQVRSACASIAQINLGAITTIAYRHDGCYSDIENFIEVSYRFGTRTVAQRFLVPLR